MTNGFKTIVKLQEYMNQMFAKLIRKFKIRRIAKHNKQIQRNLSKETFTMAESFGEADEAFSKFGRTRE